MCHRRRVAQARVAGVVSHSLTDSYRDILAFANGEMNPDNACVSFTVKNTF
jgi:hypothetical protein